MSIVPASEDKAMVLVLPITYINKFLVMKDSIYNYNWDQYFQPAKISDDIFNITSTDSMGTYRMEPRRHVVKKGETLSAIGRKYSTTATTIANLNKISLNSTLRVGQSLIVGYKKIFIPKPKQDTTNVQSDTLIRQDTATLKMIPLDTVASKLAPSSTPSQSILLQKDTMPVRAIETKPNDITNP